MFYTRGIFPPLVADGAAWAASEHESTLKAGKMRFAVTTYSSAARQLLEDPAKLHVVRGLKRSASKWELGGTNLPTLRLRPIKFTQKLNTAKGNTERYFGCAGIILAPLHQTNLLFYLTFVRSQEKLLSCRVPWLGMLLSVGRALKKTTISCVINEASDAENDLLHVSLM